MNITSWLQYDFMRNALIAVLIITPLFGIMGTMIVNKKMAYFSDALGHSALTGIAVGVVCGMADTSLAMVIFAIVFALLLNKIGSLNTASTDTIISVFSEIFLDEAAGNISRAFIISIPIHLMDSITMSATSTANRLSRRRTWIPLLFATLLCIHMALSLLKQNTQNTIVTTKITIR